MIFTLREVESKYTKGNENIRRFLQSKLTAFIEGAA